MTDPLTDLAEAMEDWVRDTTATHRAAQGTEAQRATTVEQGVVHDGPVRDSECAHTSSGGGK